MLLAAIVWILPVSFSAVSGNSAWTSIAFWLTQSAGTYGTFVIIIFTSYCYTIRVEVRREKWCTFLKSLIALTLFTASLAFINEYVTKRLLKEARPSHEYILTRSGAMDQMDSLYSLETALRADYFKQLITGDTLLYKKVDSRVLHHWIEEAGYSFPSGHSFNSFLLATVISFSLSSSAHKTWKKLWFMPFVWALLVAVSRVALGAHTPFDVSAGAALGFSVAAVFLYFDKTRKLIIHKRQLT